MARTKRDCSWCGNVFTPWKIHQQRYCSRECRYEAKKAYGTRWKAKYRKMNGGRAVLDRKKSIGVK